MAYAILRTGAKQYKVSEGDTLAVELLDGAEAGKSVEFSEILLVADGDRVEVGKPTVAKAKVTAEVLDSRFKGDTVLAYKFRRRKGYHRTVGHRQKLAKVKITSIKVG